jgi:phosphatidylinositol-3-phosphatase
MKGHLRQRVGLIAAALLALSGCAMGSAVSPLPPGSAVPVRPGVVPTPDHVMIVIFENKNPTAVIGSPDAPYLTSLSKAGANFTESHGVDHPSQPNYVALFSGSTHGVTDNSCPQSLDGDNLGSQLLAAGKTFTGYSEDLPAAGAQDCSAAGYRRKHNPWVDFADLPAAVNQPYSALPSDYADLPTVSFVVPNLCNDMHDCSVATGDHWAKTHLARFVTWAATHNSLLVVTFDESDKHDAGGNPIATFFVGPMVRAGESAQEIDHYSVLRTLEEMYGLPPIGNARNREPISRIWLLAG